MSPPLDELRAGAADYGLTLRTALPRSTNHLLLRLERPDGTRVPGQWFADPERAVHVAAQTRALAPDTGVRHLPGTGIVVQPGGADRRLPGLHSRVGESGARLVAHRPERRAVVRDCAPGRAVTYTKVVRPGRLADVVRGARLDVAGVALAEVVDVDESRSAMTTLALPGRSLFALLGDPATTVPDAASAGRRVGAALATFHRGPLAAHPGPLPRHDAADELRVARRWVGLAAGFGLLGALTDDVTRGLAAAAARLAGAPSAGALVHRDLHDKQVLVAGDGVGLLDLDLAAVGEPALDVANLLVHVELRAHQGRCRWAVAAACASALRKAYAAGAGPRDERLDRAAGYELTARIRLACVYAFRPPHSHIATALLDPCPGRAGRLHSAAAGATRRL